MEESLFHSTDSLRGEVVRILYENPDNGYCVLRIADAQGNEQTVRGLGNGITTGQHIEAEGVWENHAEYGRQLRMESCRAVLPSTADGIRRYLASGAIPGVGETLAERIVEHFGDRTLDILDNYSNRLLEVPKLGRKKVAAIREAWLSQKARREADIYLQGLGISAAYCRKLFQRYGDKAPQVVRENPYQLAADVDGIGFLKADAIARELGIEGSAMIRRLAGVVYTLNSLTAAGHCCYPRDLFCREAAQLLTLETELVEAALEQAVKKRLVAEEQAMLYPPVLFHAEKELPQQLMRLLGAPRHHGMRLAAVPPRLGMQFSREQLLAVERVAHGAVSIITGGPGVGKTTVIGEIVRRSRQARLKMALAAPTGRAAKRMSEATGESARTLHRLLAFEPKSGTFQFNAEQPLPYDLVIVDEVSMLDLPLALALFRAIPSGSTLVLVGDADQLPSVGPGTVLASLLASRTVGVTHLAQIFRQRDGSRIIVNAHAVNQGHLPELPDRRGEIRDFYWIEQDDPERTIEVIDRLVVERIPKRFGLQPVADVQLLAPMNRGSCGTISLNLHLQNLLNGGEKPQFNYGERVFKVGDKVMQTSNNYDKNVFNGDFGRIQRINHHDRKFIVEFDGGVPVEYDYEEADALTLAYAVTVHKAQGSEFPAVIVPMLTQHYMMLQRNLLYTAMTRARKLLILIGSRKAVGMAVENARLEPRYTLLTERLCRAERELGL